MKSATNKAVVLAAIAAGLLLGQLVFGKATRDSLFLSSFDVADLPKLVGASSIASLVAMLLVSKALAASSPGRIVPVALVVSASLHVAEWLLFRVNPRISAAGIYVHLAAFSPIVSSGFWSIVNERFDPHTGKKVFGRIAAGGTLGAVLGGLSAWQIGRQLPISGMLLFLAVVSVVGAFVVRSLTRLGPSAAALPATKAKSGLAVLREVPYLRLLAALVALVALADSQLDFVLKDAASRLGQGAELVTFFALFHAAAGLLSFLLQTLVSRRALDRLGLSGTAALLPASVMVGGVARLFLPGIETSVLLAGAATVLSTSLYRAAYELFYTPVPAETKRPTKTIIDVGVDRLGTTVGAGITMIALAVSAVDPTRMIVVVAIAVSMLALFVAIRLNEGYVACLAQSLRSGAVRLEPADLLDPASRRTLAETNMVLSRDRLLEEIERLRASSAPTPVAAPAAPSVPIPSGEESDALVRDLLELRSNDLPRIRAVLGRSAPLGPALVAQCIVLLAQDELRREVSEALSRAAPAVTGQLVDALLAADTPRQVRRRLCNVLAGVQTARAVAGLLACLEDPAFDVRRVAALGLLRATDGRADLLPARPLVLAAAEREIELAGVDRAHTEGAASEATEDMESPLLDAALRAHVDRRLESVFAILSLTFDREPLRIALRALSTEDRALRGTALEYLHNVLPEALRERIEPLLPERRPRSVPVRAREQVLDELLRSSDSIALQLEALRRGPGVPKPD